jgi:DNA polymerase
MTDEPRASDVAAELRALCAQWRAHLAWQRRGGRLNAPAGAMPRVAVPILEGSAPAAPPAAVEEPAPAAAAAAFGERSTSSLAEVRQDLGDCRRCQLADARQNLVFGVGHPEAQVVFVGEAPGGDEDRQGEPFVGAAGQLLTRMIAAMGLTRDEVYICNILKCRPPRNRDPEPDEVAACEPFLKRQLEAIRPRVIVALGRYAAQCLLRTRAPIGALRGRWHEYEGVRLMPTYHPAALLRTEALKRPVWDDLKLVMAEMDRLGLRRRR